MSGRLPNIEKLVELQRQQFPKPKEIADLHDWMYGEMTVGQLEAINDIRYRDVTSAKQRPPEETSWAPFDLKALMSGEQEEERPSILARSDGPRVLYRGRVHGLHGEPEACKGWTIGAACVEVLNAGGKVLYLDYEDTPANLVQRQVALGAGPAAIVERFHYVQPLDPARNIDLTFLHALEPDLVVFDGMTEAFSIDGLKTADNDEIAAWLKTYPRPFARAGAAVVLIDHVTKDRESRGRYAIGGQHKLAGVDVAYSLHVVRPFGRGREGLVRLKVEKDRPGHVRAHQDDKGVIAMVELTSRPDGSVSVSLEPPSEAGKAFRPTALMERISHAIIETPGLSKRGIRAIPGKKNDIKDLALEMLIAEEFVRVEMRGQTAHHYSVKPFKEADRAPCPNRAPSVPRAQSPDRAPVPRSLSTGHGARPDELEAEALAAKYPELAA